MDLPMIDTVATGENIKRLMRLRHLSISQLQIKLGLSSAVSIYSWCRGECVPSPNRLVHLAKIFECTVDEILITEG